MLDSHALGEEARAPYFEPVDTAVDHYSEAYHRQQGTNTTLRIHFDAGWENHLTVRGDRGPLDWERGYESIWTQDNVWTASWRMEAELAEFKVLLNDAQWSIGPNYRIRKGETLDIWPYFEKRDGRLVVENFFNTPIIIYLPPSYDQNPKKRYPVLYVHDGQNLFDRATSFKGETWDIHRTVDQLAPTGLMDEVLVVGIYNRGAGRLYDFTPSFDPNFLGIGAGGGAEEYARFLIHEIKPFIDTHFRTRPESEHTGLMGASLGGLVSLWMGRAYPEVFGKVASLSSSFWWNGRNLIREITRSRRHIPITIYIDAGTRDNWRETHAMYEALKSCGYESGQDLHYYLAQHHGHSESFWAERIHIPLRLLYPHGSSESQKNPQKMVHVTQTSDVA